uniref:C2H2-type domain-containing protein n=2 Tax=Lutzomyia longipalpis TaxID=7200 RepID=A0A1B0C806_LUTLO
MMEIKQEKEDDYPSYSDVKKEFPDEEVLESIVKEEPTTVEFVITEVKDLRSNRCPDCGKGFSRSNYLRNHMAIHTNEYDVQCPKCPKILKGKDKLRLHLNWHNVERKPHMCPQCAKIFPHRKSLMKHLRRHENQQRYECDQCGAVFKDKSTQVRHVRENRCKGVLPDGMVATAELPGQQKEALMRFECSYCGMIFWRKEDLCQHISRHVTKSKVCQYCPKSFPNKEALKQHNDRAHRGLPVDPTVDDLFSCTVCSLTFEFLDNLKEHVKEHRKDKEFTCKSCNKSYCLRSQLMQHIRIRHKRSILKEPCKVCGKILKLTSMRDHMALHSNRESFICPICARKFNAKRNLDAHMQVHDPNRKYYTCRFCGLQIKRKEHLIKHEKAHQTKVICRQCFRRFKKPELLQEHLKECQRSPDEGSSSALPASAPPENVAEDQNVEDSI